MCALAATPWGRTWNFARILHTFVPLARSSVRTTCIKTSWVTVRFVRIDAVNRHGGVNEFMSVLSTFVVDLREILYKGSPRYVGRFVKIAHGRPQISYVLKWNYTYGRAPWNLLTLRQQTMPWSSPHTTSRVHHQRSCWNWTNEISAGVHTFSENL
jgi:hypothetical protein